MNGKLIALAAFALTITACGRNGGGGGDVGASGAAVSGGTPAGFYTLTALPPGNQWINTLNLHEDSTFEASFGDGESDLDGHTFNADGTYAIGSNASGSTITFTYVFVGSNVDTYSVKTTAGGIQLEFTSDDDLSDESWFTLASGPRPATLQFASDWSVTQDGALTAGGTALVEYAAARDTCTEPSAQGQIPVHLLAATDGAPSQLIGMPVAPVKGQYRALLPIPNGETLSVWFSVSSVDATGNTLCHAWDSNYGQNYRFPIAK